MELIVAMACLFMIVYRYNDYIGLWKMESMIMDSENY